MPIVTIQRRHAEQGRIRLGQKVATRGGKTRPDKLDRFRFTSPNERLIHAVAKLYGGTAKEWDGGGRPEWEVITDAKSIPVIVVKGGFSQWMETWTGGGCVHRCDGRHNVLTDEPCNPDDPNHVNAKPTTRLSVMLRDVETLGVWRMESHGWNAAAELPTMAELAMVVGELVPADLHLVERKTIKDGQTSRFVVPVLDLQVSKQRLVELASAASGAGPAVLEQAGAGAGAAAIGARPDYTRTLAEASTVDDCTTIWRRAGEAGHLDDALKAQINGRVEQIKAEATATQPAVEEPPVEDPPAWDGPAGGEPVDADVVDEEVDAAWMALQVKAGKAGWSDSDLRAWLEQEFAQPVGDLDAFQLQDAAGRIGGTR